MNNPFLRKPPNKVSAKQREKIDSRKELCKRWWNEGRRTCGICHERIESFEDMVPDHVEPGYAKSEDESNLQPAHSLCNLEKGSQRNFTIDRSKPRPRLYPRRPGKIMKIKDAQEYWNGKLCFCDQPKKERESFCASCTVKLSPQVAYDLENADDPDTYRETLALAENEILMWRPA